MDSAITRISCARAGLLGNPSDGYGGKVIALAVRNYVARVRVHASDRMVILPSAEDRDEFESIEQFATLTDQRGYYGSVRLLKATIRRLYSFLQQRGRAPRQNFTISCESDIPRSVGLAGSSAIVTAALKALADFFQEDIAADLMASLALSVEKDLLGISAGLMDRVIQMYEGVIWIDLSDLRNGEDGLLLGHYEPLPDSSLFSHLYIAFARRAAEPTEVLHNRLQERFSAGDPDVRQAMQQFARIAEQGRGAIAANDLGQLAELIDENYDLRASICHLPALHQQMVQVARSAGASAKFCGSGGAIIGTTPDPDTFERVRDALRAIDCEVLQPHIWPEREDSPE